MSRYRNGYRSIKCVYKGEPIDNYTHVPGKVSQPSAESQYNIAWYALMAIENFSIINNALMNKDMDVNTEQVPLIILDSKSYVCMDKSGKETKHTRHIVIIMNFVRNGEQ